MLALLLGQLVDRPLELLEEQAAGVEGIRPASARAASPPGQPLVAIAGDVLEPLLPFLAEEVGDPVSRHPEEPAGDVLDRISSGLPHQPVEDILQEVLGVARVAHPPADEVAQPDRSRFDLGDRRLVRVTSPGGRVRHLRL